MTTSGRTGAIYRPYSREFKGEARRARRRALRPLVAEPDRSSSCGLPSPDGRIVVYGRRRTYGFREDDGIYRRRADGTGEPAPLRLAAGSLGRIPLPLDLSPDNMWLVYLVGSDAFLLPLEDGSPSGEPLPLRLSVGGEDFEIACRFSPDGRWIAHQTGGQVYVRRFHPDGALGPPSHVSPGGGYGPRWSASSGSGSPAVLCLHDSKTGVPGEGVAIWSVSITEGAVPQASRPRRVRDWEGSADLVPLPDGRLLGVLTEVEEEDPSLPPVAIQVLFKWQESILKGRRPPAR